MKAPPGYWQEMHSPLGKVTRAWEHRADGLYVLRSLSKTKNGEEWIHISCSRKSRLPTYEDLAKIKKDFIGEEMEAYQVMAKTSEHVNIHSYCLHIWAPIDQVRRVANLHDLIDEVGI